jgi:hypothetical protein
LSLVMCGLFALHHNGLVLGKGGDFEEQSCRTVIYFDTWEKAE